MEFTKDKAQRIEKESVSNLHFPSDAVILDDQSTKVLRSYLDKALLLGNVEHSKVKIFFEDDEGLKMVETTVWAVSEKNISLKQEVHIPIRRIHYVELI